MKSYTDLEQSKKLAEILPIESADMTYLAMVRGMRGGVTIYDWEISIGLHPAITENLFSYRNGYVVPAWSLAALLEAMPSEIDNNYFLTLEKEGNKYCCCYQDINGNSFRHEFADNPIDACVEMILKLHKEGLL